MTRRFFAGFLVYLVVVVAIHILLFIYLGGVGMANDITTKERMSMAAAPVFIINDVFGFPLSLFLHYDPINEVEFTISLVVIFLCNCLIQFAILSFLWRKLSRIKNHNS
jgi:hypothetical protein